VTLIILRYSKYGQSIRALTDNSQLAEVLGFEVGKIRLCIFAYGSILAGTGAILSALDVGIDPHVGMAMVLIAAVSVIFAGVGAFIGAALAGVFIGIVQNLVVWQISARWQSAVTFIILLFILIFRPQGIFTRKKRIEEL